LVLLLHPFVCEQLLALALEQLLFDPGQHFDASALLSVQLPTGHLADEIFCEILQQPGEPL